MNIMAWFYILSEPDETNCLNFTWLIWYTRYAEKSQEGSHMATRENITLKCSVCGEENYIGTRNKRKHTEKFEIKKYCPVCKKMTLHKEKK